MRKKRARIFISIIVLTISLILIILFLEKKSIKELLRSGNQSIYTVTPSLESEFLVLGYNRKISIMGYNFYFSNKDYTDEDVYNFMEKYLIEVKKVEDYFNKNNFFLTERELDYIFIKGSSASDIVASKEIIKNITETPNQYISQYINSHIASPVTPWLRVGMQGMLEERYNKSISKQVTNSKKAEELLADSTNFHLLSFNKDYYISDSQVLDYTEKIYILSVSFVKFLEKEIGEKSLVELYTNEYDFEIITNCSLEELKEKWLESIGISKDILTNIDYIDKESSLNLEDIKRKIQIEQGFFVYRSDNAIYYFPVDYMEYDDMWEFILLAEKGAEDIKFYLGYNFHFSREKIEYYIHEGEGASYSTKNRITLYYVKEKKAEYLHETVHVLAGYNGERFLNEGLATHLDIKLSRFLTPPSYGQDIDTLAKEIVILGNKNLIDFNESYFMAEASQEEHFDSYILAASFVKYIEEKYSRKTLLEIRNDISTAKSLTRKDYDELKSEWIEDLKNN